MFGSKKREEAVIAAADACNAVDAVRETHGGYAPEYFTAMRAAGEAVQEAMRAGAGSGEMRDMADRRRG